MEQNCGSLYWHHSFEHRNKRWSMQKDVAKGRRKASTLSVSPPYFGINTGTRLMPPRCFKISKNWNLYSFQRILASDWSGRILYSFGRKFGSCHCTLEGQWHCICSFSMSCSCIQTETWPKQLPQLLTVICGRPTWQNTWLPLHSLMRKYRIKKEAGGCCTSTECWVWRSS